MRRQRAQRAATIRILLIHLFLQLTFQIHSAVLAGLFLKCEIALVVLTIKSNFTALPVIDDVECHFLIKGFY